MRILDQNGKEQASSKACEMDKRQGLGASLSSGQCVSKCLTCKGPISCIQTVAVLDVLVPGNE